MEEEKKKGILEAIGVETVFIGIVILVIFGILSYLNIIPLKSFIPSFSVTPQPKTIAAKPVGLQCPVNYIYCQKAVVAKYNGQPALLFTVPDKYSFYTMGKFLSLAIENTTVGQSNVKIMQAPFINNNKCYTATYIMDNSSTINLITQYPLPKGSTLGLVTSKTMSLNSNNFNLMVQLQERDLNPDAKKSDTQRCNNANLDSSKLGSYVDLSIASFN